MPTPAKTLSREKLSEWFTYSPNTGHFFWRKRPERGGMNCRAGDQAGSIQKVTNSETRRRVLSLQGQKITAARAAYVMIHGSIPDRALIDHINGDTLDDRIENLRLASHAQNAWNRSSPEEVPYRKGVTKGVRGRFKARITGPDGRKINLGTWDTEAEAHAAYMGASAILHGAFSILRREGNGQASGQIGENVEFS